jgi:Protein of unknown function (DUF3285)
LSDDGLGDDRCLHVKIQSKEKKRSELRTMAESSTPDIVSPLDSPVNPETTDAQAAPLASQVEPQLEPQTGPQPTYVKLAMRNMVRKGRQSLLHFALTTIGLLGLLVGLAYLTR